MNNPSPFAKRRLVHEVIDHLRNEISVGKFPTGSRLPPEASLTGQLGVSRTTLREAMVVLAHEGLVDVRQGAGTFVRERMVGDEALASRSVTELVELKRPLYLELTRLAATRRTVQEACQLRKHVSELAGHVEKRENVAARDLAGVLESAIAEAAHSPLLAQLAQQTSARIAPLGREYASTDSWLTALGNLVQSALGILNSDVEFADRYARLWLAAQASLLEPNKPAHEYRKLESRRGPRARHANRAEEELGGR